MTKKQILSTESTRSRAATAAYIEAILTELRVLCAEIDGDFLAYLIEMALVEASELACLEADVKSFDSDAIVNLVRTKPAV